MNIILILVKVVFSAVDIFLYKYCYYAYSNRNTQIFVGIFFMNYIGFGLQNWEPIEILDLFFSGDTNLILLLSVPAL